MFGISPYDPIDQEFTSQLEPPSASHLFGTDEFGRDILSRVIYGTRIDLQVGIISVITPFVVGIVLGAIAAFKFRPAAAAQTSSGLST